MLSRNPSDFFRGDSPTRPASRMRPRVASWFRRALRAVVKSERAASSAEILTPPRIRLPSPLLTMPLEYDPLSSAFTVDATIDSVNYIVTAFSRPGKSPVGPDFSNSNGSYRGARRVKGPEDASMTIEIENAAQPIPSQYEEFEYDGSNWVIFLPAKAIGSTSAGTYSLSLRCTDIPGTVSSVTIGSGGTGYSSGSLSFSGGGGSGASGTYTVSAGVINAITITSGGSGYTTAPTVTASGGTGATLTAVIISPDA